MYKLLIKAGIKLSGDEINQINQAKAKEFRAPPLQEKDLSKTRFFLLVDNKRILAMGELIPVKPIDFSGENFSILGIGGILANKKGKGHGRQIMMAIKGYLTAENKTGIGFCAFRNKGFYEKCGFNVDTTSIKRFIFRADDRRITNSSDDCVLYWDSSDNFMAKVLSCPKIDVILPRPPNW